MMAETVLAVDVKIDFDKAFNFTAAHTWAWNPDGAGKVMMARTPDDDPEALKKLAEPIIMNAVTAETLRRGLKSAADAPDLLLNYCLLLSTGTSAQTLGQFIPGPAAWGIPPFAPGTQSLEMINQGSLVLDFTVKQEVVWRGVARSSIRIGVDAKRREACFARLCAIFCGAFLRGRNGQPRLTVWSFLMASVHGAGLMVLPLVLGSTGLRIVRYTKQGRALRWRCGRWR